MLLTSDYNVNNHNGVNATRLLIEAKLKLLRTDAQLGSISVKMRMKHLFSITRAARG